MHEVPRVLLQLIELRPAAKQSKFSEFKLQKSLQIWSLHL
jgi:hypothetical protein